MLSDTDPCDLVSSYNSKLRAQLDIHTPVINKTIRNRRQARWYTPQLREKKQECRKAERRMRKTKPPLAVHIESFDQQSKEANELLERTKEQFYTDKVLSVDGDQKALFKLSKSLLGEKSDPIYPDNIPQGELCEKFSDFFQNKILSIRMKISAGSSHLDDKLKSTIEPAFT